MDNNLNSWPYVDRRRHKMFVTKNSEYHLKDDVCVAIRSIKRNSWISSGRALKAKLLGGIRSFQQIRFANLSFPQVGECLLFINNDGEDIVTTKIRDIQRPPKDAVQYYLPV